MSHFLSKTRGFRTNLFSGLFKSPKQKRVTVSLNHPSRTPPLPTRPREAPPETLRVVRRRDNNGFVSLGRCIHNLLYPQNTATIPNTASRPLTAS